MDNSSVEATMTTTMLIEQIVRSKPEFLLSIVMILAMTLVLIPMAIVKAIIAANRHPIRQILDNPAVKERLRDQNLDICSFIERILKEQASQNDKSPRTLGIFEGLLEKINHDITWDVSGLIGLIVTVVLMIMVVSRSFNDIPREIMAGWTVILGFYFGKATK